MFDPVDLGFPEAVSLGGGKSKNRSPNRPEGIDYHPCVPPSTEYDPSTCHWIASPGAYACCVAVPTTSQ